MGWKLGFSWSNKPSNGFRCWKKEKERGLCWSKSSLARSKEVCSYILFLSLVTNLITKCSNVSFFSSSLFVASFSFLYIILTSRSHFTHVYWRVGVDTCPICTFHQSPCSCKAKTYYSSITSTLMRPES